MPVSLDQALNASLYPLGDQYENLVGVKGKYIYIINLQTLEGSGGIKCNIEFMEFHDDYLLAGSAYTYGSARSSGKVYLIDLRGGVILKTLPCSADGARPRFYDGKIIAASGDSIQIWDLEQC